MYIVLEGRLTRDAMKKDGFYLFTLAVNYFDAKQKESVPCFVSCFCTDDVAKGKTDFLKKGRAFKATANLSGLSVYNENPQMNVKITSLDFSTLGAKRDEETKEEENLYKQSDDSEDENLF